MLVKSHHQLHIYAGAHDPFKSLQVILLLRWDILHVCREPRQPELPHKGIWPLQDNKRRPPRNWGLPHSSRPRSVPRRSGGQGSQRLLRLRSLWQQGWHHICCSGTITWYVLYICWLIQYAMSNINLLNVSTNCCRALMGGSLCIGGSRRMNQWWFLMRRRLLREAVASLLPLFLPVSVYLCQD